MDKLIIRVWQKWRLSAPKIHLRKRGQIPILPLIKHPVKMNIESNPASRLHRLLTDLLQGEPNEHVLSAWARVLDVTGTSRVGIEVPRRLVLLNDLLDDAEQSIKLNPALNLKMYLACFPQIRVVLTPLQISARKDELI